MKRCLIVTTVDSTIKAFLLPHIELLMKNGVKVDVASNIRENSVLLASKINGQIIRIPFSRKIKDKDNVRSFFIMRKLLKKNNYDFIHVHTPIASFLTRMAARKSENIIYTAHGFHTNDNGSTLSNSIFLFSEKLAAKKTKELIVMNKHDYNLAKNKIKLNDITMVNGVGVDTNIFSRKNVTFDISQLKKLREELSLKPNDLVVTHIAELNNNKRQIDVVNAAKSVKERYENVKFLLVGKGENIHHIKSVIEAYNLEDTVKILGYRNDIDMLLNITDIGLLVSLREGLPRSVMEMMAMEIPVIVTDIRGNNDLIEDSIEGFCVPIKRPDLISEKLLFLNENKDSRENMGKKGRESILRKFSLEKVLADMENIYSKYI
ncbi:glycosyltransferase family 4 protein [Peribacillus simplex]|uniref:glycosyltransferase family 4 protein n=1 Tax=Peribacillus simplex TaxID=1478 RepID=UPI0010BE7A26|nr:glycosyltransferase family 4 protein [Peribacillus simplex]TKH00643.1 glycosyltransferase family 4 protein [Peribacillus simplex]